MKKIFEPLKLEINYFDEADAITCSFPRDESETEILGGGFSSETGEFANLN